MIIEHCTFEALGSPPLLEDSTKARFSTARSSLNPSELARIFIPLSLVVTASKEPSLLNRSRGLA